MAIDTSIYSQIQQPQLENPLNALAKVSQVQALQSQNRLADLSLSAKQNELDSQNALSNAFKGAVDPTTGAIDKNKLYASVAQAGQGAKLPGLQKQFADADTAALAQQKAKVEQGLQHFEVVGRLMSGVKDQASYDAARQQAAQMFGPEAAANLPPTYDPATVARNQQQALSIKEQMEQRWKSLDADLKERQFGETVRNNKTQNGIAAGNLGVAQANLGLRTQELQQKKLTDKAPTEFQGKSAAFGARAEEADRILSGLKYSSAAVNAKQSVEGFPLIGGIAGPLTNKFALTADDQKAEQAQRDFINAVLRQESGAAISPSEFENAKKQYFPQPGDKPETIAQKASNRKLAIQGFKNSAGKAAFSAPAAEAQPNIDALLDKYK